MCLAPTLNTLMLVEWTGFEIEFNFSSNLCNNIWSRHNASVYNTLIIARVRFGHNVVLLVKFKCNLKWKQKKPFAKLYFTVHIIKVHCTFVPCTHKMAFFLHIHNFDKIYGVYTQTPTNIKRINSKLKQPLTWPPNAFHYLSSYIHVCSFISINVRL